MKDIRKQIGINNPSNSIPEEYLDQYISLRLAEMGFMETLQKGEKPVLTIAREFLANYNQRIAVYGHPLPPIDIRIQDFINSYFREEKETFQLHLPHQTFVLDSSGIARYISLPKNENEYHSEYVSSYRIAQGVLHNPKNDRRTTKGVFHISEGGLPIPDDKKSVPRKTAAFLLERALHPEEEVSQLPYTSGKMQLKTPIFVSLLLRPTICPEVPHMNEEKNMEIHCFAPGSLVSNLDFLESIFGNGGNPMNTENDAGMDVKHWSGHTGCIILAPQLTKLTKQQCGLPPFSEATKRQKRDGMCWKEESELYNDGQAFKLAIRNEQGTIVTIIADNYFGYSKKEVKSMLSYAANLLGNAEEEHAGGALVFPAYNQGYGYISRPEKMKNTFADICAKYADIMTIYPEGYGRDKKHEHIFYVPENVRFSIDQQKIWWTDKNGNEQKIKLLPQNLYITPNGSKFRMEPYQGASNYRLVEAYGEGTFIHKPCTVSGGGKSEISKSISDAIFGGSFFINDFQQDFNRVEEIINYNYSQRYKNSAQNRANSRSFLSPERSMGSVIKLLTPSDDFSAEYNAWLGSIPQYIKGIAFIVKRFYKQEWGKEWRKHFSVDILNGQPGNELKFNSKKIYARYLRVGFEEDGTWRTFKLRQDFVHADKLQMEDDISVSTVIPINEKMKLSTASSAKHSVKLTANCEYRFFQRPDGAIVRGYDHKAESDLASPNTFISNFEPLTSEDAREIREDVIHFDMFTDPMRDLIDKMTTAPAGSYFVSSAHPRLVNGVPSKNVRYLQLREDLVHPETSYAAEIGLRFARGLSLKDPLYLAVDCVLPGRRNNPSEKGIRPLAVYNPIHYQELPELFMDFICSLTGKSPSTTGAGSEGALTKGPFNALCAITDLNNALISYILTGYHGFSTPAGYIGRKYCIDHDISLLIPEIWARLSKEERDPQRMIALNHLEKLKDFDYNGKKVRASILGFRITMSFVNLYFGRVFENPNVIFTEEMLKPEKQSMEDFVDGINNIVENQSEVAKMYFEDGSIEAAIPPLKALLHIMVNGNFQGKTLEDKEIRDMFTYEYVVNSNWYKQRLSVKQQNDLRLWKNHEKRIRTVLEKNILKDEKQKNFLEKQLNYVEKQLQHVESKKYLSCLNGTLGKDPLFR